MSLSKYNEQRNIAFYSWLRWLMLIAAGAFSLTAGLVLGKPYLGLQLLALKVALTANAIGILSGSIAVYGEAKMHKGFMRVIADNEIRKIREPETYVTNKPLYYHLPWWVKYSETICYLALIASLALWLAFIWLH